MGMPSALSMGGWYPGRGAPVKRLTAAVAVGMGRGKVGAGRPARGPLPVAFGGDRRGCRFPGFCPSPAMLCKGVAAPAGMARMLAVSPSC